MSNGRSEDTEVDFKEISLDQAIETPHCEQVDPNLNQNLGVTEINEFIEGHRSNLNPNSYESDHTWQSGRCEPESSNSESTQLQSNLDSLISERVIQRLDYGYNNVDEIEESRSPENTSSYLGGSNFDNSVNYSTKFEKTVANGLKNSDNTEDEPRTGEPAPPPFKHIPIRDPLETSIIHREALRLMTVESDEQLSESSVSSGDDKEDLLSEGPPEYNLSDQQSGDRLSEPAQDLAFSDTDLSPKTDLKVKHRKKHKSTSKPFESIFQKSATCKSGKTPKSKTTTAPTSPGAKENIVVTTSTSSMSSMKKKDKSPSWTNYEIPSKPGRKGPTLGVFYDSVKSPKTYQRAESGKDQKCIVLQTPDSLERYLHPFQVVSNYYQNTNYIKYYNTNVGDDDGLMNNYYFINMMTQRKSLLPYYVTKTIFGNVPGMGRVLVCGTQCGKIIFYSFFTLDELLVLDTRTVYDKYLSRDNSIDSESGCDMNKAIDSTLFEVNCLSLISTFHNYSSLLAIGNHLGHLLLYQIPKLHLIKVIYPVNLGTSASFTPNSSINTVSSAQSHNSLSSQDSISTDTDEVLIDELELLKIRRYKDHTSVNRVENGMASDDEDVVFISCLGNCASTGDLWVGYGNGNFAIYSRNFKLKYFYNSNRLSEGSASNIILDQSVYSVNAFEFCNHEQIVLVLYGNVKVDIFTFEGVFLSTISATRLTNNATPISTIHVSNTRSNSSILYMGLMDGSLLMKRIVYTTSASNNGTSPSKDTKGGGNDEDHGLGQLLSNNIEFILLYNLSYKIDGELNFGAPVTSICPVPSQHLVLLGNASGGLSVISNLDV
ncbi:hypothetical protein MACK_000909 [Theileria orientalis]|uniref:Uncharacterized protein n=1 Tax=Theileria orientalis TaxID=68886 RepID=A0A976QSG9_THEOR|nr:hypothetical protein MACK_000909 [Theileria orientalis]